MRLIGRQDSLLVLGLVAAAAVLVAQPVQHLLEIASDIQQTYGIALVPAFIILTFVFIVHQQGKRQQMKAEAAAAAATAQEAQERAQDLEQLVGFGQALARSLTVEAIREVMSRTLPRLARSEGVWVLLRTDGHWRALLGAEAPAQREGQGSVPFEHLADRALSLESDRRTNTDGLDWEGYVCFPMVAGGTAVGVLGVPDTAPLSESQRRVVAAVSALLAVTLKNAQLFQEVRDNSLRDGLTGLLNKTHGLEVIDTELRRARRSKMPVSLVMFDIDHFKQVNDRYGHLCGDAVLAAVARRTRDVLRGSDVKCRYGGEEFLILLPDTGLDGAQRVAETLRHEIGEVIVRWNAETVRPTASFGVTAALPGEVDADALIGRADAALYRAKDDGRNCVRVGTEQVAVG